MTFAFAPAKREQVSILVALAGASGSGKTMSALRLAQGMSPVGKIAFIDTEARRGLHYADQFSFMHADMRPPFRPTRFLEAIEAAEKAGAEVAIIDSFSHEYDGEDGILDWAAAIEAGGEDDRGQKVSGLKAPGNWKVPKLAHKRMMNGLLQARMSLIFCLRADEKIAIEKKEVEQNGRTFLKTVITPLGWMPICEKRFMFEMTASFTLRPDAPGIPQFDLPHKLQQQHRAMFPAGEHIGQEAGKLLAAWARGGEQPSRQAPSVETATSDDLAPLILAGDKAAKEGGSALYQWWNNALTAKQRLVLGKARLEEWKVVAQQEPANAA